jgi:SAM-dependent methyltransferase
MSNSAAHPNMYTDGTYASYNKDWGQEESPWKAQHILRAIRHSNLQPKTVAEIGCGAGNVLASLKQHVEAEFLGYDISPYAIQMANAHKGITFELGGVEKMGRSDLVLGIDIIEHIEDCFGFLRELRQKGEWHIFHIPLDMNFWSIITGQIMRNRKKVGHLHYFTKDTALALLAECGYTVCNVFYTGDIERLPSRPNVWWRKALYSVSPDFCAKFAGCYNIMVTCR